MSNFNLSQKTGLSSGPDRPVYVNSISKKIEVLPVQKGLCYFALTIAVIVFACFLADLLLGVMGRKAIAPFHFADQTTDIVFVVCSLIFGLLSWFTLKEQV